MSDQKSTKRVFGRGRGKPKCPEGPWSRSKKLDDPYDVRPPKKDGEQFLLSEDSFPPLPGAVPNDGQFSDPVEEIAGTSQVNGVKESDKPQSKEITDKENVDNRDSEQAEPKAAEKPIDKDNCRAPIEQAENKAAERPIENCRAPIEQTGLKPAKKSVDSNEKKNFEHEEKESALERRLRLEDLHSKKASQIFTKRSGLKLLLKPSGRKFRINEDGTLGRRYIMLDDINRMNEYNVDHYKRLKLRRARRAMLRELHEATPQVDITNSNLSPLAAEFVPRAMMNPNANAFVPSPNSTSSDEANNNKSIFDTAALLGDLEETVTFCYTKITESPGSYDELMGVVTPHIVNYMENPDLPNEIVVSLYNYAIQDTKFSYFAVKILIHLIKHTATEEGVVILRDLLLKHVQKQVVNIQDSSLVNPECNCVTDVEPTLMFLSELYIQLEVGGMRLGMIGSALTETLHKLLAAAHIPLKDRLKLIVKIMKLTGLSLDEDAPLLLDGLVTELELVMTAELANLDEPTITLVNDLLLLRTLSWGRIEPDYLQDAPTIPYTEDEEFEDADRYDYAYFPATRYNSGVFYGPDGIPIGREEQLFLEVETDAVNNLQLADGSEPSPTSVEGFDEAYDEFLKTVPGYSPQ